VDAYGPVLLHLIAQDIHPEQLCDMIGMCKAAKSKQQPAGISNESDENNASESVEMAQLTPAKATVAKAVDSDAECLLCEFAMNLLAKELKSNKTEPEIEALLRGVCNKRIPSKFKNQCNAFIDQYGPIIIELIVNEVEPEKICVAISLCPGPAAVGVQRPPSAHNRFKDEEHLFKMRQRERAQNKQRAMSEPRPAKFFTDDERKDKSLLGKNVGNNTIECSLCVYVAEMIDAALAQNKTEEQIVGELLLVCNLFPGDLKSQVITGFFFLNQLQ
jgi:saposin